VRGKRLTARRSSWSGSEQQHRCDTLVPHNQNKDTCTFPLVPMVAAATLQLNGIETHCHAKSAGNRCCHLPVGFEESKLHATMHPTLVTVCCGLPVLLPFRSDAASSQGRGHVPTGAGSSQQSFAQLQASSSSSGGSCHHQASTALHQHALAATVAAAAAGAAGVGSHGSSHSHYAGFQLHSRLSQVDDIGMQHRRSFGSSLMQAGRQLCDHSHSLCDQDGGSEGDWRPAGLAAAGAAGWAAGCDGLAAAGSSVSEADGTLPWYEEQMQEVRGQCACW
jgi:hypothetical protein